MAMGFQPHAKRIPLGQFQATGAVGFASYLSSCIRPTTLALIRKLERPAHFSLRGPTIKRVQQPTKLYGRHRGLSQLINMVIAS